MRNKKAMVGSIYITFIATIIIVLVLIGYAVFSILAKTNSSIRYGMETKDKEINMSGYFYTDSVDSFRFLYNARGYIYSSSTSDEAKMNYINSFEGGVIK